MSQSEKNIQNYRTLREQQGWADAIKKYLSEKYETPPLAHVHSFGCQQSVYDGERFTIPALSGKTPSSGYSAMWGRLRA